MEYAAALLLLIWLLLTVLNQLPIEVNTTVRRRDPCHLIPRWHFFAPKPALFDFQFVVRLFTSERRLLRDWESVSISQRTVLSALWNPARRLRKLRADAAQMLMRSVLKLDADSQRGILLTVPYLLLLNHACSRSEHDDAAFVQFAVLQTHGFESDRAQIVLLRSELHSI